MLRICRDDSAHSLNSGCLDAVNKTHSNVVILQTMFSTLEDIYVAQVDTDRGQKEKVHFYDTAGLVCYLTYIWGVSKILLKKMLPIYLQPLRIEY